MSMFLNILILIDAASVAFLLITFLMINLNEESLELSQAHRENGKKALVVAIILYVIFLVLLFIYKAYKNKRKLYTNFFMKKRNAPKYVQLASTYLSASDEYEQYELNKI
ncbi:hypothetical protein PFAG_00420 [Plasmodium falciparum Santa Lucia]|uniref:Uncharacterized protein n=11 Tax=Plasmodium falciparum TaxID=5833 RepID=O77359_PLAF7|nr:conserved Plasmodium protein, unknown function [Plasmodium falciparum 3D7]ETW20570.1 hypothetical protein PFFVO_00481 [Plasmodium falciparum Vietnam Oak-Knoll (FVO)]ETW32393.1 hypothetical protein PFFCH_00174 [Plasmodium falciparum FCH/4]ETW38711.1 hypothetical protein PFTANZ_00548 [Plasmodium falciparum Tanzania (2000708)]ETW51533.1 hypothetical protein PFMALIP_00507 [Plasmodium falciparum MaliPS096_E11]ETW63735.1 hypothetical protein PFMC_00481 [Plasmodium falciparum CAMP/Malaysia]EUT922|eukprot:XP_001351181.1 conserved Plasmodium protein, unknown function [Plasmodium falciparum 3D7]